MDNEIKETPASVNALKAIEQLTLFALRQKLIEPADLDYSRNVLLEQFGFSEPYFGETSDSAGGSANPSGCTNRLRI